MAKLNWALSSMGCAINILEAAFELMIAKPEIFLEDDFTMDIVRELSYELQPFKKYLIFMFKDKLIHDIQCKKNPFQFNLLCHALFYTKKVENITRSCHWKIFGWASNGNS